MTAGTDLGGLPGRMALESALVLAVVVPAGLLLAWAGYPLTTAGLLGLWLLGVLALALLRLPPPGAPSPAEGETATSPRWLLALAGLALLLALGVFLAKLAAWPLWSWDHYQIWGVKARRMVLDGRLDLAFLHTDALLYARPDYPLGVPFLARMLAFGDVPGTLVFKAIHAACGLGIVALLLAGLHRAGGASPLALGLAAWAASGPLFWDSEATGLAEMPLAFVLLAAAIAALDWRAAPARRLALRAGLLIGLLPWIKHEGRPLALFLLAALLVATPRAGRWRERVSTWAPLAATAGVSILLERAMAAWGLGPGVSFLSGQPPAMLAERLPQAPQLLASMGGRLLQGDFLGFWLALPLALALALRSRQLDALLAGAVVLAQLALYSALTFAVYLPAEEHLDAAYDRIAAALVPLGILACGLALVGSRDEHPSVRLRERR